MPTSPNRSGSAERTANSLSRFSAIRRRQSAALSSGIEVQVRYVTRASERFEVRNRLYQKLFELMRDPARRPHLRR